MDIFFVDLVVIVRVLHFFRLDVPFGKRDGDTANIFHLPASFRQSEIERIVCTPRTGIRCKQHLHNPVDPLTKGLHIPAPIG